MTTDGPGIPSPSPEGTGPRATELSPGIEVGVGGLTLIAGPCVIESRELVFEVAGKLVQTCEALGVTLIFKASFDKANRTAITSFRSIGMEESLGIMAEVKKEFGVPVTTDVHEPWQCAEVAEVIDVLQIPSFLCRQTDLLVAAGKTGRTVNIKKGQFMAPDDMGHAVQKVWDAGGSHVALTERGTTFGYHDLVVDFRSLAVMRAFAPVIFDATHSVQSPGGGKGTTSGKREYVSPLARAAVAFGTDGLFLECHPDPDNAPSDGPNMLPLTAVPDLLEECLVLSAVPGAGVRA